MDSLIEFGDFKVANLFISTSACVELPASWSSESDTRLSFFFTSKDGSNGLPIEDEFLLSQISAVAMLDFNTNANNSSSAFHKRNSDASVMKDGYNCTSNYSEFQQHPSNTNNDLVNNSTEHAPNEPLELSPNQPKLTECNNQSFKSDKGSTATISSQASNEENNLPVASHEFIKSVIVPVNSKLTESMELINTDQSKTATAAVSHEDFIAESPMEMTELSTIKDWASVSNGITSQPLQSNADEMESLNYISTSESFAHSTSGNERKDPAPVNAWKNFSQKNPSVVLVKPSNDPHAKYFADEISRLRLVCRPQAFIPRGLINSKNWCYVNATLQALLVCPPFFHMLRKLYFTCKEDRQKTSTPIMDSFVLLASEFRTMTYQYCQDTRAKDLIPGAPFSPGYIYDMLSIIESSLSLKGGQEDAEEFLSCILNGFHEEIINLFGLLENDDDVSDDENSMGNSLVGDGLNNSSDNCTIKSKTMVPTKAHANSHTPISNIFRGELCTIVIRPGQKPSVSYEPFFTLPIDVPTDVYWSVDDALYHLTEKENFVPNGIEQSVLGGGITRPLPRDGGEQSVLRHQTIAQLPPILILHLKRFVYDKNGGLLKLNKAVHFKNDLIIRPDWLTDTAPRYSIGQRSYKLFAVVYHHGERATGGHYSTDVFHFGKTGWLRIDDQNIWPIHQNDVTKHSINRTPYLLYYRQMYV